MRVSELIKELNQALEKHGDLEVRQDCSAEGLSVKSHHVYYGDKFNDIRISDEDYDFYG